MTHYFVNKSSNNYFVTADGQQTITHYWKKTQVSWSQPTLSNDSTSVTGGTIQTSASSVKSYWYKSGGNYISVGGQAYRAMQLVGLSSQWIPKYPACWWQVRFPYNLYVKGLRVYGTNYYDNSTGSLHYKPITSGRFYTNNTKQTPIGQSFTAPQQNDATPLNYIDVTGIPADGILTNVLYYSGNNGMLQLQITATKEGPNVEGTPSDYDFITTEVVNVYLINKGNS